MEHLLIDVNLDLDFAEKCCIFVIEIWGSVRIGQLPIIFAVNFRKKTGFLGKKLRRIVEKSQGFVKNFLGLFEKVERFVIFCRIVV